MKKDFSAIPDLDSDKFEDILMDSATADSSEHTPLLLDSANQSFSNNYLPDTNQNAIKFLKPSANANTMNKKTSINSKAFELFFKTIDPSFFLIPYVFQRQGLGVALFFLMEFQFFAYLSGRAFMEIKQIHSQLQRTHSFKSNFILFDLIDYFCESKNLNVYFKTLTMALFSLYSVGGLVFTVHVYSSLVLNMNAMIVKVIILSCLFGFLVMAHRTKQLSTGSSLKMVIFALISTIIIYQCLKSFQHQLLPLYTYDIDDTFGLWGYAFFLPFFAILSKSYEKLNHQDQIYQIYTRYNVISAVSKVVYGLTLALLIQQSSLEKSPFGFSNYVLSTLFGLQTLLFIIPAIQESFFNIDKACTKLDIPYLKAGLMTSIFGLSLVFLLFEKQAIVSFCNYVSIFINFQFINIVPFTLLYRAICMLEESQTSSLNHNGEFGISDVSDNEGGSKPEYGGIEFTLDKEGDALVMKSIDRVFSIHILKKYMIKGQIQRAKYWTLGLVSSGLKTIVFMSVLVLYSLIAK